MKIEFQSETRGTLTIAVIEVDPAHILGTRSSFGPLLHLGIQTIGDIDKRYEQPVLFEGQFKWPGEGHGAFIPLQSVGGGTTELVIPLSDHQVAAIERTRAGREPTFNLSLRAIGMPDQPGKLGRYTTSFIPPLQVPRDTWIRALHGFGVGTVRIVELPAPPRMDDERWGNAFERIESAARFLSEGQYGEAVATARVALERIAEAVGDAAGAQRNDGEPFAKYIQRLSEDLRNRNKGSDPFALIGQLIRTANGWTSHPVHQGFHVSQRDDAIFAVNLCTALYSYLVHASGSIKQSQAPLSKGDDATENC